MKRIILSLVLPLVVSFSVAEETAFDVSPFQFQRQMPNPSLIEGIGVIRADAHLFEQAAEKFADLRLVKVTEQGKLEWPYLVERDRPGPLKVAARLIASDTRSFEEGEDKSITISMELRKEDLFAAKLQIQTPLRDFEKSVDVWGGNDGVGWEPLVEDALVFDRERFLDFRRTEVELPENQYRFFKVVIEEATDEQRSAVRNVTRSVSEGSGTSVTESDSVRTRPFRVDGLTFYTAAEEHEPGRGEAEYPVSIESTVENKEDKSTEVILAAGRAPLRAFTLVTEDRNFSRKVRVEIPRANDAKKWQTIHRGAFHLYDVAGFQDENLTIRFDEQQSERYRLVIENEDSRPIAIDGVEARGSVYKLLFLAEAGDRWELFYGADSDEIDKPDYDIEVLFRARQAGVKQDSLEVGEWKSNPLYGGSGGPSLTWLSEGWVLKVVIALVVACLVWVLVRTAGQITLDDEPKSEN